MAFENTLSTKSAIYQTLGGFIHFQYLYCACKFRLFDYLHEYPGATIDEISEGLKLPVYSTRVLVQGAFSLRLIEKAESGYGNSAFASFRLRSGLKASMLPAVRFLHHAVYNAMFKLDESLEQGRNVGLSLLDGPGDTLYDRMTAHPEMNDEFYEWLMTLRELGLSLKSRFSVLREFLKNSSTLLDVGGGRAYDAIDICQAFPFISATIMDLPVVCEGARENIEAAGYAKRIRCVPGDIFANPFPGEMDTVLLSNLLDIYSPDENRQLIAKSFAALRPGGHLVIFSLIEGEQPEDCLLSSFMSAYFLNLASGKGMIYSLDDLKSWCKSAGFQLRFVEKLGNDNRALIVAQK